MLEYFATGTGTRTAVRYLQEGDTKPYGDDYELRYAHEFTGGKGGRHVIEAHHPEDGRVGRMEWMGRAPYAVHDIKIEPEHRRQGLATAMWNWAQEQGRPKPKHSRQRTDMGDVWARSVGGTLPRRQARHEDPSVGLLPKKVGSILEGEIEGYFGGGSGRNQDLLRVAGRGKPRRDPDGGGNGAAAPQRGGRGAPASQQQGEADPAEGRPEGPRSVEFHPQAHKDLKALDKPVQKQIMAVVDDLANDRDTQTHALTMALKGWYATKASRGHRIVHRRTDEGGIHVGYIGLHEYDKAIRRLTNKQSVRQVPPEEYSKYHYPDYRVSTLPALVRHFKKTSPDYFDEIKKDVRENGFTTPVLIRTNGPGGRPLKKPQVMEGHHRAAVAYDLGIHLPVGDYDNPADYDVAFQAGQKWFREHQRPTEGVSWKTSAKSDVCPCGLSAVLDPADGWQHADGSVSHDGEHYGKSVSELMEGKRRKTAAKQDVMYVGGYLGDVKREQQPGDFRRVLYTSPKSQLTAMTLQPGEDIGKETHTDVDQILVLIEGEGECLLGGNRQPFTGEAVLCVPQGVEHNVINTGKRPMRLATVYAPAHHAAGTVHHTKADAKADKGEEFKPVKTAIRNIDPIPRYQELDKPWERTIYDVPEKVDKPIYRGMAIPLSKEEHDYVHDRSIRPSTRAAKVLDLAAREPLGMHWSLDEGQAHHWSRVPVTGMGEHPHVLSLVLHAHPPEPEHIEHDPRTLWHHSVQGHVAEGEVPLKEGAPVRIHGVEWSDARDYTKSHRFWAGPGAKGITKNAKRRPKLKSRIFGPSKGSLDPALFEGTRLRPEVRTAVLSRLGAVLEPILGKDWERFTKVYLAGSQASEWWGNHDFDTLIGIDFDHLGGEPGIPVAGLEEDHITDMLNSALRVSYNASPWKAPFGGEWDVTGYCNKNSYDIRKIKPYAAYNISDNAWAVRPPHLLDWSVEKFPEGKALLEEAKGYADIIEAIDKMPEPFRTQQGQALWEHLHGDRSRAFSERGEGWMDPGNAVEKALVEWGLWDKLVEMKFGPQKTASKGEYCETCKTEHEGYFEPEDHERSHTDWDRYYDKIRPDIHRGMAVQLSPEAHRIVHGDAPEHEKAQALMHELSSEPLGMHWTDNSAEMAGNISQEDAEKNFTPRQRQNLTHVIFHADKPAREHIETDINRLVNGSVISYPDSPENEVPLKENAPVNIWGVSWNRHDSHRNPYDTHEDAGWHFHEFEQPVRKTAGAKVEHVLIDKLWPHREWDHQPGGYSYDREGGGPHGWKHDEQSWESNKRSVSEEGIQHPITLEYNPKIHSAYIGEGNHRLHWAKELGHETVPVKVWRTSKEMHPRYRLPGAHRLPEGEHISQELSPRAVLPEDYFPAHKTAGAKGETPELTFRHLMPEENHSYGGAQQDTHTLHAHLPDGSHIGELSWFGEDGMIRDVDVSRDHRRKGIASELLQRAREIQPSVHHSDALTPEGKAWAEKVAVLEYFTAADEGDTDYRMQHRPPDADFGAPLHDLAKVYPEDIYTHPHYYDGGEPGYREAHSIARRVKGQPDAKVTIYRALPAEYAHQGFRPGDWVSTSKEYARQHGMHNEDSQHDWPVIRTTVPAKHLQTNGDSLLEYGYTGPHKDMPMVSFKGGYHQEVRHGADGMIKSVQRRKSKTASDYRLQHRAPDEDSGKPYHEYFGGHEDDPVRIYRAAPHDVDYLDNNTWVTTDPDYAHLHAEQYDGSKKWPVMSAEVPAKHVYWDENDSNEFGYQGPRLEEHHLEEHDQEFGLKPFESQAPKRTPVRKKSPRQQWGIGIAHLTPQEHGDSLLHLDHPVALKAVDQALPGAEWSESSSRSEDQAADRLNGARGHGPEGTRPVGVIMRAQDGKVDRVALRHHHDDLDPDHPFSGMEIHRSGSFHDLEQDARPMGKTASLIGYFGVAA